jgi:predicted nucleic acid-binding protein
MSIVVLDAAVLLGFCDPDDPAHPVTVAAVTDCLAAGSRLIVPVSVLSEVLVGAYRTSAHAVRTVEGFVDDLITQVYPIDRPVGRAAAQYRAEHPDLPLYAAFVLATAKVLNARQILTTDPSWKQKDSRVHILRYDPDTRTEDPSV